MIRDEKLELIYESIINASTSKIIDPKYTFSIDEFLKIGCFADILEINIKKEDTIPFIFLTAKADRSDVRKGMELGADDYVTKPFDDVELLAAVETRLKKSSLMSASQFTQNQDGFDHFIRQVKSMEEFAKVDAADRDSARKMQIANRSVMPSVLSIKIGRAHV